MKCVRLFKPLENEKELVNKKGESKEIRLAGVQFEAESLFTGISKKMIADHLKEVELYKTQSLDFLRLLRMPSSSIQGTDFPLSLE